MIYLAAAVLLAILFLAPLLGMFAQPWAPIWFGQRTAVGPVDVPIGGFPSDQTQTTDVQRYQLAIGAGWNAADAVTVVAISIAEDGSGNPAALSGLNKDGSRDLGLLQINSSHWQACGGPQALTIPSNNFACGHSIYLRQGWCAWSTYEPSCGPGHTGSYRAFISRAQRAAHEATR